MEIKAGTGKKDMTCLIPGIGMMGYGQPHNIVKEAATSLWARSLFLTHEKGHFILVHLEQAFVTLAIKEEVLKRLSSSRPEWKLDDSNLAITAQHTHSAPGGYSHYPLYNFTIPGFQTRVFSKIIDSILESIEEAFKDQEKTRINWGRIHIEESKEIAFNRSISAHALNPEASHHRPDEKHLAVDRNMEGLSFVNNEGRPKAFLNWFGVHCTSISSYNQLIHHDNKGVAASLFEKQYPGTTAFFLQSSAGDVSPNFIWDKRTKLMRGKFEDQYENAAYNGELQFREAEKIKCTFDVGDAFSHHQVFMDMSKEVSDPAHGAAFLMGTLEGPGVSRPLGMLLAGLSRIVKKKHLLNNPKKHSAFYEAHGAKDIVLDHRSGSFIGIPLGVWKRLPPIPDPAVEAFRKTAKAGALETLPWVPSILPFQVLRLGEILLAFVPGEISVMAGRRLKNFFLGELKECGIKEIFITSYANAYMGYIVTPEEYDKQCYEGGHTVYGRNTLGGIMKGFSYIAAEMKGQKITDALPAGPFHFPPDELKRRSV